MLETACRPGEISKLQWADVNLLQREIIIRAEKAKTRHDLRHEAASQYEQAGVPVSTVSKLLGHTCLTTTYLNTLRRELHRAVQTREAAGKVANEWQIGPAEIRARTIAPKRHLSR